MATPQISAEGKPDRSAGASPGGGGAGPPGPPGPPGPAGPPGSGVSEILVVCDTSAGDVTYTLPDPATFTDPKTVINVKNIKGGVNTLTIQPGIAGTIDNYAESIQTLTNNQGFRFRTAQSADTKLPVGSTPTGWVCIETCFGGDDPPTPTPPYLPGPCSEPIPTASPGDFYDVQTFKAGGTWTKPAGAKAGAGNCVVDMVAGGGGGGSGCMINCGGLNIGGGGAGGGGQRASGAFNPSALPGTVPIVVGTAGVGAIASPWPAIAGSAGSDGGDSSFGNFGDLWYVVALGGKAGGGGTGTGTGDGGLGGGGTPANTASAGVNGGGGGGTGAGTRPGGNAQCGAPGGGAGAFVNCTGAPAWVWQGFDGGAPNIGAGTGGAANGGWRGSAVGPTQPAGSNAGGDGPNGDIDNCGYGGGGGGMGNEPSYGNPGGNGGKGGKGGFPGAGGGGGGGKNPWGGAYKAGSGGNGAAGIVRVTTLCH